MSMEIFFDTQSNINTHTHIHIYNYKRTQTTLTNLADVAWFSHTHTLTHQGFRGIRQWPIN